MQLVVVGSGIAGVTFSEEIRKRNQNTRVTLVTRETHGYYSRPLLSHGFTREDIEEKIIMKSFDALENTGIHVKSGVTVEKLDPSGKSIQVRNGSGIESVGYDKLVLATGSAALIPRPFRDLEAPYFVLNGLDNLIALRALRQDLLDANKKPRWAIIGGGLIGCEVASDLAKAGDEVHLFHAMERLMERQLVEEDSENLLAVLQESGINVRPDCAVQSFKKRSDGIAIVYPNGEKTSMDAVILACGFSPRTELANAAELNVNRGILVNEQLQTSDPSIFAIGDVAECADGKIYAYVTPIRNQAIWLAGYLSASEGDSWSPPFFKPRAKVHGFNAEHPYLF